MIIYIYTLLFCQLKFTQVLSIYDIIVGYVPKGEGPISQILVAYSRVVAFKCRPFACEKELTSPAQQAEQYRLDS